MTTVNYINVSLELCGCIMSILVGVCLMLSKYKQDKSTKIYFTILLFNMGALLFDALALFFRGKPDLISFFGVRITNFLAFTCNYFLMVVFVWYLTSYLEKRIKVKRIYLYIVLALSAISIILVATTQFTHLIYHIDELNIYRRDNTFFISHLTGIISMVICGVMLIRYRKVMETQEEFAFWTYLILPIVALTIQIFTYGVVLLGLANTISIVLIFLFLQQEQGRRLAEQENELTQSNISIMLSQIQPHFLYNALNTIQYLCETDPKKACITIESFSLYLRENMDSLAKKMPIPFKQDLEHLENYLAIDKLRFPNIKFEYDLKSLDFKVPALTLQPLVENAIKHGIRQSGKDGIIKITTYDDNGYFYIKIEDNGVGFDTKEKKGSDSRSHVGLSNTKSRIKTMCHGDLKIESTLGIGTKITINIPKGAKN